MQKLVETGKYTEINKQFHVKFWPNWSKYRTLSYSFSRKIHHLLSNLWDEKTIYSCCSWHYWMRECATYNTNLKRTQPSRKVKLFYLGCLLQQDRDFHGNVLCTVVHVTIRVGTLSIWPGARHIWYMSKDFIHSVSKGNIVGNLWFGYNCQFYTQKTQNWENLVISGLFKWHKFTSYPSHSAIYCVYWSKITN